MWNNVVEEKIKISDIPTLVLKPKDGVELLPTIIFYHGWSSNKDLQRFRGSILASLGFQVIIPDAIYHGERKPLSKYGAENSSKYFWDVILQNIEESSVIIGFLIDNEMADEKRIGITGHSMGGFTAAGIFTHNEKINSLVVMNGSLNWGYSNKIFKEALNITEDFGREGKLIQGLDPMNNFDSLKNRPILILHGEADPVVNINPQRLFYNEILPLYNNLEGIRLIEYPGLGHFVTTNMMEAAAKWFKKFT